MRFIQFINDILVTCTLVVDLYKLNIICQLPYKNYSLNLSSIIY